MAILTSAEYPAIRAALDTDLTADTLPDEIISLSIYAGAADNDVLKRDPDAESRTGSEATRITNAAIYYCAARLAPAVVRITSLSINTRDLSYQKPTWDPAEKAAELRALADAEIDAVLEPDATVPARPTLFGRAAGRRGK